MKRTKDKKRGAGRLVALALCVVAAGFTGFMAINASFMHLRRATVWLEDLPPAFEGATILYASDIDLGGVNTPRRAARLFEQLGSLEPDILILGGDYTAPTLMDLLNQSQVSAYSANASSAREDFFYSISSFPARLGRYLILSPDDRMSGDMRALAEETGFKLLDGEVAEITRDGESLFLFGVGADTDGMARLSRHFNHNDCVVAVTYSPNQFPALMTSEAGDSGHWVDLVLSGHTHGGQIRLFGRSILSLDSLEQQFVYDWNRETGVPMLVNSGVGCEGANLRLNTQPEVWLITLTNSQSE